MSFLKTLLVGALCAFTFISTPVMAGTGATTAAGNSTGTVVVKETDGAPNVSGVTSITVTNGSLTDNGSGSVSLATAGAANITVDSSAVTGGVASSFLYTDGTPVLKQVSITGLVLGGGASAPSAYGGTSCTNQALRALNASGTGTCVTLTSAYVDTTIWTGTASSGVLKASSQGVLTAATAGTDYTVTVSGTANQITLSGAAGVRTVALSSTLVFPGAQVDFTESAGDGTCNTGDYWIKANSTTTNFRKCMNGAITDLDTGGAGSIGGSTGGTDKAVLIANGTGGATVQASSCTITAGVISCSGFVSTAATTGTLTLLEGTAPGAGANAGENNVYFDSADHKLKSHLNGGSPVVYTRSVDNLSTFAATTSAQLAGVLSDETGSGVAVFGTSPTIATPTITGAIAFQDGVTQTFNPDGTNSGFNVGSQAGNPSLPNNGDIWYNASTGKFKCREGGATVDCISTGAGTGDVTDVNAGTGIAVTNPGGPAPTVNWDPTTQVNSLTFWDGANASRTLTINLSGTDPVITFSSSTVNVSTGALQVGGVAVTTASSTDVFTNKTYDAEGTGNVLTIARRIYFPAAGCNNTTAGSVWNLPTSNPAVAACVTGTNTQKGVLDFAAASDLSAQLEYKLPSTWTGNVDVNVKWFSATTSGDVVWQTQTVCVADAETDDPAFNAADSFTADTTKGTTNQTNDASKTNITMTGCAAGELLHLKIRRQGGVGADTMNGTARLIGIELVIREAI